MIGHRIDRITSDIGFPIRLSNVYKASSGLTNLTTSVASHQHFIPRGYISNAGDWHVSKHKGRIQISTHLQDPNRRILNKPSIKFGKIQRPEYTKGGGGAKILGRGGGRRIPNNPLSNFTTFRDLDALMEVAEQGFSEEMKEESFVLSRQMCTTIQMIRL